VNQAVAAHRISHTRPEAAGKQSHIAFSPHGAGADRRAITDFRSNFGIVNPAKGNTMDDSETEALTDQTQPEQPEAVHAEQPAYAEPAYSMQPYQPVVPVVQPRTRVLGAVVSIFFPGVGSMINGNVPVGIVILVGWIIAWFFTFFLIGIPFLIGFWAWGIIDGALSADRWNRDHGIIS
jgi:TM2 domain-containing membrane protein YozV